MPPRVAAYYNAQWHCFRDEWVEGLKKRSMNLGERTNNRIESFFGKLKSCVNSRNTLQEFITSFLGLLSTLREERRYKSIKRVTHASILPRSQIEREYSLLLTDYAFQLVQKELGLIEKVKVIDEETTETDNATRHTTTSSCECSTFTSLKLPCRHILAIRTHLGLSVCDPDIVHRRWRKDYTATSLP